MPSRRQMVRVEGLRELDHALTELPKATARTALRNTLKKEGQRIADAGAALAPKDTGSLQESYQVSSKLSRRQRRANSKQSMVEVYIGPTSHPKSVQTEFGNAHQAAHPHLRPAWDSNVRQVLNGIKVTLADKIEKARARLARKAQREAAKMKAGG